MVELAQTWIGSVLDFGREVALVKEELSIGCMLLEVEEMHMGKRGIREVGQVEVEHEKDRFDGLVLVVLGKELVYSHIEAEAGTMVQKVKEVGKQLVLLSMDGLQ